jgi:hypothetical protein
MLHFLIGVALILFIGERLVHYWSAYRRHRAVRRGLALLRAAPHEPNPQRIAQTSLWFLVVPVGAVIIALILAHS